MKPLVSVFLPYYNDEKFLNEAIESILAQTYSNFELFLFNHASNDKSREIAHSFDDERIIHIDAEKNLRAGSGLNLLKALPKMRGEYVKLFCADDIMLPECLEVMVEHFRENLETDVLISDTFFIDENGKADKQTWFEKRKKFYKIKEDFNSKNVLKLLFNRHSPIPFPANLIKKECLLDINIDKTMIYLFDIHLWASLLVNEKRMDFIKNPLIAYREHKEQLTVWSSDNRATMLEVVRAYNIFYEIKNIELIKLLCPASPYIENLKDNETEFFPFILAHYLLTRPNFLNIAEFASYRGYLGINGYLKIRNYMQDEVMREKLEARFKFDIAAFRKAYSYWPVPEPNFKAMDLKRRIYTKHARAMNLAELVFLFIREIYNLLTLKWLKKDRAKTKKTILLTGSRGFIGKNLKEYLDETYDIFSPESFELNLCNNKAVKGYFKENNIDFIIHCAVADNAHSAENDALIVKKNLAMVKNLAASRKNGCTMIILNSATMYDKTKALHKVSEKALGKPVTKELYGKSKMFIVQKAQKLKNVLCLNIFACYGKGGKKDRLPGSAIVQNINNKPIVIEQNGVFDYIFIEDVQKIVHHFLTNPTKQKVINLTPNESISLVEMAKEINKISGFKSEIIVKNPTLSNECTGDNSRLTRELRRTHFKAGFTSYSDGLRKLYRQIEKEIKEHTPL